MEHLDFTADPSKPDVRVVPDSLPADDCDWTGHRAAVDEAGYCPVCQHGGIADNDIVYRRIGDGRYDVYVGLVRVGWVIRRPDGWIAVSVARDNDPVPTVCGAPSPRRRDAAARLLATEEPA